VDDRTIMVGPACCRARPVEVRRYHPPVIRLAGFCDGCAASVGAAR